MRFQINKPKPQITEQQIEAVRHLYFDFCFGIGVIQDRLRIGRAAICRILKELAKNESDN